ncbi:MAG TPA: glucans biosynthesis glucosyltransferase MdoH [Beijerinckiaceae bacterium]|nr:glucans biosynthesis glucosyltransferase MdoH [Beijerinckiaceae bacterium]
MAISLDQLGLAPSPAAGAAPGEPAPLPAIPAPAPLAMPVQSLKRFGPREAAVTATGPGFRLILARLVVFGGALALTFYGGFEMYKVVSISGTTFLQYVLLILFIVNFSWIALAATSGVLGFVSLVARRIIPHQAPASPIATQTAIVMPVYNERTDRCFAAVQAIFESVEATGEGTHFDFFILSDTTDPDIWVAEEVAFFALRERLRPRARVYYRHRAQNLGRKAGNIADFVTRWGGAYAHMIVLDADSLMTGECILALTRAMEADPHAGIIQSLPLILNRNTLFARVQQFAARFYGPIVAAGLSAWSGKDGNYWGHNAIIRLAAFAGHAGLPSLPGKPPFGGHILSHDFVEAALIRRGGWSVSMLPDLEGSYEEGPPSLIDLAVRDRRWCQGNLQHARVILARGLQWSSRQHFATGIAAYVASPLWLMQLIVGLLLVLQTRFVRPEYFTREFSLYPAWPRFDAERALSLFILTMAVLLVPKALGWVFALCDARTRRDAGGAIRLTLSALLEIVISALLAPVLMLIQSGSVFQILSGRDTGWNPQRRDDGSIPLGNIIHRHFWHTAFGIVAGISAYGLSPYLFAWMSPTILGLVLAIPLSAASGLRRLGLGLRRAGLLLTPEERSPPVIVARANALTEELSALGIDETDGLRVVHGDLTMRQRHIQLLPEAPRRTRGEVDPHRAVAEAKLIDAETFEEASSWLKGRERTIVLSDRALIILLAALPSEAPPAPTAAPVTT